MSNNYKIIDMYEKKCIDNNYLFEVELDITNTCNANCIFCYQGFNHHKKDNELPLSKIENLLDELREMGVYYVQLSGGEPFARNDVLKIIEESKKRGFRTSIITNGTLLNNEIIDKLAELNIDRLNVSFHSINKENYCKIFNFSNTNYYDIVINNIKYMISKNINVGISVTINKLNVSEICEIYDFFVELGIKKSHFTFQGLLRGNKDISPLVPNEKENLEAYKKINEIFGFTGSSSFICNAGRIGCTIDSAGNVKPCSFFSQSAGNIYNDNICNIWENSELLKIVRSFEQNHFQKCNSCNKKEKCHVCLAANLNETGNVFVPSETYCSINKKRFD